MPCQRKGPPFWGGPLSGSGGLRGQLRLQSQPPITGLRRYSLYEKFTLVKTVLTDVLTLLGETVTCDYAAVPPGRTIGRLR